jgi:pyruvate dehydrogenase E1 component alpha subunit
MERAVIRARRPSAPTLLEIRTYRLVGHSMSDPIHGHYRTKEEVEAHRRRDPILLWSERLKAEGLMDDEAIRQLDESVKAEVQDAWDFAEQSPDPEPGELWTDVYAADAGRPAANAEQ